MSKNEDMRIMIERTDLPESETEGENHGAGGGRRKRGDGAVGERPKTQEKMGMVEPTDETSSRPSQGRPIPGVYPPVHRHVELNTFKFITTSSSTPSE